MGKKIITFLMTFLLISASFLGVKTKAAEEVLPKISFVGVNSPVIVGSKGNICVLTKYSGKVQYKVFAHEPGTDRKIWSEVTGKNFTEPMDASEPYVFPSYDLSKEGEYTFAIRVKRAGITGKFFNFFGDYDDAYAFDVKTVKNADVKSSDIDGVTDTYFTGEKIKINGFKDVKGLEYKLHTFNTDEGWKKDQTKTYHPQIEKAFDKSGLYVLDLWGRKLKSNKNYEAYAVKTVKIIDRGPIDVKIEDLNEVRVNFNRRVSGINCDNFMIDGKPLDVRDTVELMGNGTYAVIKRQIPFEQNKSVKFMVKNVKESDGKLIANETFNVKASDTKIPEVRIDNLTEINVQFGKNVSSISSENFLIDGKKLNDDDAVLSDDLRKITILKNEQFFQKQNVKVTVTDVKYEDGSNLSAFDFDIIVSDFKSPNAIKVEQIGLTQLKVVFDEPILRFANSYVKIDDNKYYINQNSIKTNNREVIFDFDKSIQTGNHKLKINGATDYAGNISKDNEVSFNSLRDNKIPKIMKVEKGTQNRVILEFSKEISLNIKNYSKYYHSDNKKASRVEAKGKKLIITFDNSNKMPEGKVLINLPEKAVVDNWGNYSEVVYGRSVEIGVDTEKPEIKEIKVQNENEIEILFTEELNKEGFFRLYDKDGKEVSGVSFGINYVEPDRVKLVFSKPLEPSSYSLSVEGIKDIAGNEMSKELRNIVIPDMTPPKIQSKGKLYSDRNMVRIFFSEPMNIKDITDLSNYQLNNNYLLKMDGVFMTPESDGMAVAIQFKNDIKITSKDKISIAKVRDVSGNYTAEMVTAVSFDEQNKLEIEIESANLVDRSTVVITIDDSVDIFEPNDFEIYLNNSMVDIDSANKEVSGGKTKLIFKLKKQFTGSTADGIQVRTISKPKTTSDYGIKLKSNQLIAKDKIVDCIPPEIELVTFSNNRKEISIRFSENVKGDSMFRYSFNVSGNTILKYEVSGRNQVKITLSDAATYGSKVYITVKNVEDESGNVAELLTQIVDVK